MPSSVASPSGSLYGIRGIYTELTLDEEEEKLRGVLEDANSDEESEVIMEELIPTPAKDSQKTTIAESPIHTEMICHTNSESLAKPPANFAAQPMASILKATAPLPAPVLHQYNSRQQYSNHLPHTALRRHRHNPKRKPSVPPSSSSIGAPLSRGWTSGAKLMNNTATFSPPPIMATQAPPLRPQHRRPRRSP
ncbi:hypothetical protein R3P38DRAFT_2812545 [Favolaschia claudopus]|uniref:Uncharacterized protein n=1 Tax=Favolaschia claudopus TaxID=2862362 RepID=A0AAV9Z733_9AGAR